jgi:hypothetical protein
MIGGTIFFFFPQASMSDMYYRFTKEKNCLADRRGRSSTEDPPSQLCADFISRSLIDFKLTCG